MNATTQTLDARGTQVVADADVPTISVIREFDATPDRVFQAHVDPELFAQWVGPDSIDTQIDHWDARTGGSWSYTALRDGAKVAGFYGSFHEVRTDERLVQTFTYDGVPDGVSLETATFTPLPGGRCRLTIVSVVDSMALRDTILASGMEVGVREGYAKLDAMLAG